MWFLGLVIIAACILILTALVNICKIIMGLLIGGIIHYIYQINQKVEKIICTLELAREVASRQHDAMLAMAKKINELEGKN